jgi:hypothetical protein
MPGGTDMNEVKGTMNDMYKRNLFYEVSVTDLLNPEAKSFMVGFNGRLSSYPTRQTIRISGAELKVLMDAQIPQEVVEMDNGFRKITGLSFTDRFSINMKTLGAFPSAKSTILQPFGVKAVHLDAPMSLEREPELGSPEDIEAMPEPEPEVSHPDLAYSTIMETRRSELEMETKDVLTMHAESLGIKISPRMNKSSIIDCILGAEGSGGEMSGE